MPDLIIPDIGEVEGEPSEILVSEDRYREVTGDTDSSDEDVETELESAQRLIEEYLRRPLVQMSRTESIKVAPDGNLYPRATPISSVTNGQTVQGDGYWLSGGTATENFLLVYPSSGYQSITYVGGYTDLTLPETIRNAIIWTAYLGLHPSSPDIPFGAESASIGDASVSFGSSGGSSSGGLHSSIAKSIRRWIRREP